MWVLPGEMGVKPSYGQVEFPETERLNRWLTIASGRHSVDAPVRLTQDAAFFVTQLQGEHRLRHTFDPGRLGFLFVADGDVQVEELDAADAAIEKATLKTGDAVRTANLARLSVRGDALLALWDVPRLTGEE
jgi:redox-sensitive bicupin YhaK (pirin superfamily)